jgi:hypothetical protein
MQRIASDSKPKPIPGSAFIPAWLDDFGLDTISFRVLAHIWRRGSCWESRDNMALCCRIHVNSLDRALANLLKLGLIQKDKRQGSTSIYYPRVPESAESSEDQGHTLHTRGVAQHTQCVASTDTDTETTPPYTPDVDPLHTTDVAQHLQTYTKVLPLKDLNKGTKGEGKDAEVAHRWSSEVNALIDSMVPYIPVYHNRSSRRNGTMILKDIEP